MSYINSDLLIPWSNYKPQASHNIQKGIKDFEAGNSNVLSVMIKSTQIRST